MKKQTTILSLGAGVQSTTLYLMLMRGEVLPAIDAAIFADTGEEPEAVYQHLEWLKSLRGPQIITTSIGRLGDHLMHGRNSTGGRFASIPAFTKGASGKVGKIRRQCTREYKVGPVERAIRRQVLGLKPRCRIPKDQHVLQYIGISLDEAGRAVRVQKRFDEDIRWGTVRFPLIEKQMTRADCLAWLRAFGVPHEVPRSACVFCPYHDNAEWLRLKTNDPAAWRRIVQIDEAMRVPGNVLNRGLDQQLFLHRSCKPIAEISFTDPEDREHQDGMRPECEGMCGN